MAQRGRPRKIGVGDYVKVTTSRTEKVGRVAAIVPAGMTADEALQTTPPTMKKLVPTSYRFQGGGAPLDSISYVVVQADGSAIWPKRGTVEKMLRSEVAATF